MSAQHLQLARRKFWLRPFFGWSLLPALGVYVLTLSLAHLRGKGDLELVIRDLAQTCGSPLLVGLLSNLGYLLWMAAASVCLFSALSGTVRLGGRERQMLLCGGGFSLLLCFDDMFLLHDRYVNEVFLYLLYAAFALLILLRYRVLVMRMGGGEFLVSVGLMGASIVLDKLQSQLPISYEGVQLLEEGAKFVGIAAWFYFWWKACVGASRLAAVEHADLA